MTNSKITFYTISGLGADESVFDGLSIDADHNHIDWIKPLQDEPLASYSKRMANAIDISQVFGLIGLSFGGLVAMEIAKLYPSKCNLLISSAQTKEGLSPLFRLIGKTPLLKILPTSAFYIPKPLAHFLFGTRNKEQLSKILDNTDKGFVKWALNELTRWENEIVPENTYRIHGSKDKIIPPPSGDNVILLDKGEHLMIIDEAEQLSSLINQILSKNGFS